MDSALNPREIQTRIRAGESVDQVARATGVPVDQVEAFATPVLAERRHQAASALSSPVRRRGETGSSRSLEVVVGDRLLSRGIDPDDASWDAWRGDNRIWTVQGRYRSGDHEYEALFHFDPRARFSTAANEEASALIGEVSPAQTPGPARRRPGADPDAEPTVDLNDEAAFRRAAADAAEMTVPLPHQRSSATVPPPATVSQPGPPEPAAPEPESEVDDYLNTELEQVDGVYDFVPSSHSQLDTLYDMLSSFNEDSVNIYAGLDEPPLPGTPLEQAGAPTEAASSPLGSPDDEHPEDTPPPRSTPRTPAAPPPEESGTAPRQDALVDQPGDGGAAAKPKRRKRASVPTWDEIMFGGPGPRHP